LPARLVENRQPIKAVIDVLEHEKFLRKTGKKSKTAEMYEVMIPKKHQNIIPFPRSSRKNYRTKL
jgi:hypothetical protein